MVEDFLARACGLTSYGTASAFQVEMGYAWGELGKVREKCVIVTEMGNYKCSDQF